MEYDFNELRKIIKNKKYKHKIRGEIYSPYFLNGLIGTDNPMRLQRYLDKEGAYLIAEDAFIFSSIISFVCFFFQVFFLILMGSASKTFIAVSCPAMILFMISTFFNLNFKDNNVKKSLFFFEKELIRDYKEEMQLEKDLSDVSINFQIYDT